MANPFYTPSLNDYQNGSVTLRLTAISVGECSPNNPTHEITINLIKLPVITLAANMDVCQDPDSPSLLP